ncbi:MAG: ATP-binding protein [Hyphomonadaceae bacterium]
MSERRGLPIAAHLGLMVALAFASAFVAMMVVLIFLPPKPPDVMRGDHLVEKFVAGYEEAQDGRLPDFGTINFRITREMPDVSNDDQLNMMGLQLAGELAVRPDQVLVAADAVRGGDNFVFQVQEIGDAAAAIAERQAELAHEQAERAAEREAERAERAAEREIARAEAEAERQERLRQHQEAMEEHRQAVREAIEAAREAAPYVRELNIEIPDPPDPPEVETPEFFAEPPEPPEAPEPPEIAEWLPAPPGTVLLSGFTIAAEMQDGRWLVMTQGRNWAELGWIARAGLVIGLSLAVLAVLALYFARRIAMPIRSFATAVQAVGVDPQSASVKEDGPRELQSAARAVNTMQARLRALIADRTKTLATVAHDMRTPLMRLKLLLENADPEQRDRMAKEIDDVQALVSSFIAFARDDPAEEARVRVDLGALLQSLADDSVEAGRSVTFEGPERLIITGQPLGLKRLFGNLIDNAIKYGGRARVRLTTEGESAVVEVEDDGPGVPEDQRETVFEPFVRLSQTASGAGLGLPAARSIARAHGGDIAILDGQFGARVRVALPL